MATVTKSIGSAGGRDYATLDAWEDDLNDGTIYNVGDLAVGECYDDSVFSIGGRWNLNNGTSVGGAGNLIQVRLSVAAGERHTGIAGSGARVVATSAFGIQNDSYGSSGPQVCVEWLEFNHNGYGCAASERGYWLAYGGGFGWAGLMHHCIVHNIESVSTRWTRVISMESECSAVYDNILYDMVFSGVPGGDNADGVAIRINKKSLVANNTIWKLTGTATCVNPFTLAGVHAYNNHSSVHVKNNIAVDVTQSGTGYTVGDFIFGGGGSQTAHDYNLSSDSSASGTNSLTSKAAADQFVSTTGGSEDLRLKSGADAIGAGVDLGGGVTVSAGNTYGDSACGTLLSVDVRSRDRDAEGDTWDIGADQFVASAAAQTGKSFLLFMD